jgi:hypothetical protein
LPSAKSFNNRIYFVDVSLKDRDALDERGSDREEGAQKQSMVLKVWGQFFGPDKSSNRNLVSFAFWKSIAQMSQCLSSLLVLKTDSPFATTQVLDCFRQGLSQYRIPHLERGADAGGRGWVLMTGRPGRLIRVEDLRSLHSASLM